MLDAGVVVEAVLAEVLAVAGVLEAAVGHLGDERDVGVDPHAAEVEALGHPHRPADVLRPHARRQPVLHAVGPAHGLVLVAEALHGDDRAEDLVLDHLVVLAQVGDDGRLVEVARSSPWRDPPASTRAWSGARSTNPDTRASWSGLLTGPYSTSSSSGMPVCTPLAGLGEGVGEVAVDARPGEHAGRRRAVLAGVEVAGGRDALDGGVDVGVVEHDDRRLAAELEVDPLEVGGRRAGDLHAGAHRAGDRHHVGDRRGRPSPGRCRGRRRSR